MRNRFAYWSIATGSDSDRLQVCVESARRSGVTDDFIALTDRSISGANCFQAHGVDANRGLHQIIYLKAALSQLSYEYFVFLDCATVFYQNPDGFRELLGSSPIHTPLYALDAVYARAQSSFVENLRSQLGINGVRDPDYYAYPAFWIVHHDAIDRVYELTGMLMAYLEDVNGIWKMDVALTYAMLMLCANPKKHLAELISDTWKSSVLSPLLRDGGSHEDSSLIHEGRGDIESFELLPYFSGQSSETMLSKSTVYSWKELMQSH